VWVNNGSSTLIIPSSIGKKSTKVAVGEYFGTDGRFIYKVVPQSVVAPPIPSLLPTTTATSTTSTTSTTPSPGDTFNPFDFEQELFTFFVNGDQFRLGNKCVVNVVFDARLVTTDKTRSVPAMWTLILEIGEIIETVGGGINLANVNWLTPCLEKTVVLSDVAQTHTFGLDIRRALVNNVETFSTDWMAYGYWTGGATPPPSADFAVRARMTAFDTADNLADPRGFIAFRMKTDVIGTDTATSAGITNI
jgi:hypothetical protein